MNMKCPHPIAALVLILFTTMGGLSVQAQQVYKCVKNGKTSFQNVPCEEGSASTVQSSKPASPSGAAAGGLPWEGLRLGMSVDEVKRAVSGTREEEAGTRLRLQKQVTVAGIAFDVTYSFDAQGKQLVEVHAQKVDGATEMSANDANLADYEKLKPLFRAKYGTEASSTMKNKETGFPGLAADSRWSAESGRVFVAISPVTATTSNLFLGYQK
jgi:hypothetical protein